MDGNNTTPYVFGNEECLVGSLGGLWPIYSGREIQNLQIDPELSVDLVFAEYRLIFVDGVGAGIGEKNGPR